MIILSVKTIPVNRNIQLPVNSNLIASNNLQLLILELKKMEQYEALNYLQTKIFI